MNVIEVEELLEHGNAQVMSQIFNDLIEDHHTRHEELKTLYKEYDGDVSIKDREEKLGKNSDKANNKLANDYRGMAVDQALAYTFAKAIDVQLEGDLAEDEKAKQLLKDFKIRNKLEDLDYSTAFYMGIDGYCPRLLYVDTAGEARVMNIKPWECIFIYSKTVDELDFGLSGQGLAETFDAEQV